MAAGDRPAIAIQIVSKADKSRKRSIGAAWVRDDGEGLSGKFDKTIAAIKFTDGTVAKAEDVWFNVYDNRTARPQGRSQAAPETARAPAGAPADDSDDIPF